MGQNRTLVRNGALNLIRRMIVILVPLLVYPYVARTLGSERLGAIDFSRSLMNYFVLLSSFGISAYGIREVSKIREQKECANQLISELVSINIIFSMLAYLLFGMLVYFCTPLDDYKNLLFIQCFTILFNTISIDWINSVYEDYLFITVRTIVIQLIYMVCVFAFVRSQDDYLTYVLITVGQTAAVSILNAIHCRKYFHFTKPIKGFFCCRIRPLSFFFANKLAISVYVGIDVSMLGFFTNNCVVGIYSAAIKIYAILKDLMAAIYEVCIPRLAYETGKADGKGFCALLEQMLEITTLLLIPMICGVFTLSDEIIYLLFGEEYDAASGLLRILCFAIFFAIYGGIITSAYCIPMKLEKINLKATIYSAVLNVILNMIAIPRFSYYGAAVTTVISEAFVLGYCLWSPAKSVGSIIQKKKVFVYGMQALGGAALIVILAKILKCFLTSIYLYVPVLILLSMLIYLIELILCRNPYIYAFLFRRGKHD